ncbi:transmembrane protein, putative (macronuclear) [Tetrahymena thermophila SB210]|uniref:Transmembrane protein, putative n=1 Tax=Tetrahymena thermophila (strain SB210) TaxID=312017 RepID=W7XGT3_TETTS|nr:transmembrane protein, putative [Tetrahymena thermophila SB210]EWS73431.1 transmembrane protein, putative [Tetrahymena thermophila SB210]|eukprot:XP_012654047.1 transmembrane protein, putative [Tetrahymena thermophila SB210]
MVNISNFNVTNCQYLYKVFDLWQINDLKIVNTSIVQSDQSTIYFIQSTIISNIQKIQLTQSTKNIVIQIKEQDINTVQYLSDSAILKDIEIFNSVDTIFSFKTNKFEVSQINVDLLQVSQTIFTIQASQINITNLNIRNTKYLFSKLDINLIYIISFNNSQIENVNSNNNQIQFLSMNQQNSEGYALISKAKFMNSTILNNNPLIFLNQLSSIDLKSVLIKDVNNINSKHISILTIQNCDLVSISESYFTKNTNSNGPGGAIYALDNTQITIQNSIFWLNTCKLQNGGAIYMINTITQGVLQIYQSQLIENKSVYSSGGSIYLQNNNMIMQNSVIASNQAQIGGGIYYVEVMPDFLIDLQQGNKNNNTFKDNLAHVYGQNFGSTLRKVFINLENIKIPKNSVKLYENKVIFIKQFKSGDQINFEQIQLLDEENNPIRFIDVNSTDFSLLSSDVQSLVQQISVSVQWNQENKEIQCIGQLQTKQFINGGFNLDAQIFYKPISELVLKIVSNSFPSLKDSNGNIVVNSGQIELILNIELEQCSIGQIFKKYGNSIACESCPDGKYSLSLNDQECRECPDSAVMCIGSNIQLKNEYWREDEYTDNIIYCSFNPQSCQPQLVSSKFYCIEGYKGPLCYQCDTYGEIWGNRYSEIYNHGDCYKCEENILKIILYNFLVYLMISLYIIIILRRIIMQLEVKVKGYFLNKLEIIYLGSTLNQSDRSQIISKILTDHLQILSLVCSFTTKMPAFFTVPIQLSGNSVSVASKSIDCVFSKHPNLQPLWLLQFLWSFTLPAGIIIFYLVQAFILKRLQIDFFIRYLQTAAIFIYFYFYPMIITLAIRSINCITIGDKKYLDLDFGIECYDKHQHKPYIFLFTIPVIFIWGILIPLLLFYKIHDAKSKKKSIIKQIKYSFLFAGYKKQYYYWEFWKLSYKTSLILISVLLKQEIYLKVSVMNLSLVIQFFLLFKSQPYLNKYFNSLQQISTLICIISLNLCMIQIGGDQNDLINQIFWIGMTMLFNFLFVAILIIGLLRLKIHNQQEQRTGFQNFIFSLKNKYPQLLDVQIQNNQKVSSLLKFKKLRQKIKQLMKELKKNDILSLEYQKLKLDSKNHQDSIFTQSSPQTHQINQFEINDEKFDTLQNNSSNKTMKNKWSYYTRNPKKNSIFLKDRISEKPILLHSNTRESNSCETESSLQNNQYNSHHKFQIQLSLDKS